MRWLSAALIVVVSASVSFVVLWFIWILVIVFFGGTECDRGECPALGEWADENRGFFQVVLVTMSVLVGLFVARASLRKES
jgi:hypothetical protein